MGDVAVVAISLPDVAVRSATACYDVVFLCCEAVVSVVALNTVAAAEGADAAGAIFWGAVAGCVLAVFAYVLWGTLLNIKLL